MAKAHGKGSSLTFPNLTVGDFAFTINDVADVVEVTDFANGAAGFKAWLAGLRDTEYTVQSKWDDTPNTAKAGDSGTLVCQLSGAGNLKFSQTAICTGHTVTSDVNDAIVDEWTFKGNGALTVPAA
jgi:hypothetical protein